MINVEGTMRMFRNKWYWFSALAFTYGYITAFFGLLELYGWMKTYDFEFLIKGFVLFAMGFIVHYISFETYFKRVLSYVKRPDGQEVHS